MKNNAGSFFKGTVIGAIGGAIAALLLAPKSGKETREDIKNLAVELGDKATDIYNSAKKEVLQKVEQVKNAGQLIDETKYKELVANVVDDFKNNSKITESSAQKLGAMLRKDWERVKKEISK